MAAGDVWISKFFSDTSYVRGGKVDWDAPGWRDLREKRSPSPEALPLPVYAVYKDETYDDLPPIFTAGGPIYVCATLAKVLRNFDLGEGSLGVKGEYYPVRFYLYDRVTHIRADYFLPMYGEKRDGLIPEQSSGLVTDRYSSNPPTRWMLGAVKDGDIAVRALMQSGPDFWFDTGLQSGVFMSDRLVQALKEAGFAQHFKPIRCRVLDLH